MLVEIITLYVFFLFSCFISTVTLILLGKSWENLPFLYLKAVEKIQRFFPDVYPSDSNEEHWPSIIHRDDSTRLLKSSPTSFPKFDFTSDPNGPWAMTGEAIRSGLEGIIQDDLSYTFDHAPSYKENLLRWQPVQFWTVPQKVLFYLSLGFRVFLLFPVRLILFIFSFVFLAFCALLSIALDISEKRLRWISVAYCRIFAASLGVVASYNHKENTPRRPGLVVANHITPNDVQIIWAGVDLQNSDGYIVTGQKHKGLIGYLELLTSCICPSLWLERSSAKERADFLKGILNLAKTNGPILLFPEGYCSNNQQVLQFRKAAFEDGIDIYPMAIKQDGKFADAYWFENAFHMYLLRLMFSWATVYNITYLEKVRRASTEDNADFAARVQAMIANEIQKPIGQFDGGLWYKKIEQERLKSVQQENCARTLLKQQDDHTSIELCRKRSSTSHSYKVVDRPLEVENVPTILAH